MSLQVLILVEIQLRKTIFSNVDRIKILKFLNKIIKYRRSYFFIYYILILPYCFGLINSLEK
ncbi:hypothetical protein BpHYR1_020862 [Brachionus plicatilis]|uniref:Uncharacterized protein n=1 Tax=Brachionus plicatilis TaxID=10195 RepID=A0A3M7RWR9_BRAPC|nr:hypothetical protein BpHYR1_020862 [Brachionus plicatilis]